jgi:hypothetical protein
MVVACLAIRLENFDMKNLEAGAHQSVDKVDWSWIACRRYSNAFSRTETSISEFEISGYFFGKCWMTGGG